MKKVLEADSDFEKDYWDKNYSEPETMDGIGNAKDHALYLKNYFKLDLIDISSVIDFGCGTGHLFKAFLKTFIPYKAVAIEPSNFAFKKLQQNKFQIVESMKVKFHNESIEQWCFSDRKEQRFDLGICTSVFQYLAEDQIKRVLPIMASRVKYLYFTVPTKYELERQVDDLGFYDEYARRRSQKFYLKLLKEHFTIVSSRVLESKSYFNTQTTLITDLLFRL
jgi:SAM-dependent methyltransferase